MQPDFDLIQILARPLEEITYTARGIPKPEGAVFISKMNDIERRLFHVMRECQLAQIRFEREASSRGSACAELAIVSPDSSELIEKKTELAVDEIKRETLRNLTHASTKLLWGAIEMRLGSIFIPGYPRLCIYGDNEIGVLPSSNEED